MRFFLLMAVFGVVAVALESTWLSGVPAQSLRFDVILVAVAAVAFSFERGQALPVVIFFGLLMDVASEGPFGMSVFSYLVIYGIIRTVIAKISFQTGPALLFWIAIVSLTDKSLTSLVLLAATGDATMARIIMRLAPAQAILDAVVGLVCVPFLGWYWDLSWEKITRPKGLVMK